MKITNNGTGDQLDGITLVTGDFLQIIWPDGIVQRLHVSVDSGATVLHTAYRGVKVTVKLTGLVAERITNATA